MRRKSASVWAVLLSVAAPPVFAATLVQRQVPEFQQGVSDGIAVPMGRTNTPP